MKIFIASSIVEFERERDLIENYLWRLNKGGEIAITPLRCESADPAMSVTRKEDDYCDAIKESDVCLFLLGKKVGAYTIEEYDCAQNLVKEGKPLKIIALIKCGTKDNFCARVKSDGVESYDYSDEKSLISLIGRLFSAPAAASKNAGNEVNIFLASSIKDDERQKLKIENFIWRMNGELTRKYSLFVRPLLYGELSGGDLSDIITRSAMCFFIVFGSVDSEVLNELKLAKSRYDESKSPRIYVYFKEVKRNEAQSVKKFKNYLDRELNHFYGQFSDVDTIKLRILLNLAILKDGSREVVFRDGKCYLGDSCLLNVKNVSEFANNKRLAELKKELEITSVQFRAAKVDYERNPDDGEICRAYFALAQAYDGIKNEIARLEDDIFSVSLSMSRDEASGGFTEKQRAAYKLFMDGDVEKAVAILDLEDSINAYERMAKRAKQAAANVIAEGRQKIEFLTTMYSYSERDALIEKTYNQLLPIATEQRIELGIYNEYALFLRNSERHGKALETAEKLQKIYEIFKCENRLDEAENLTLLAVIYSDLSDRQKETVDCALKSIEIREEEIKNHGYNEKNYVGLARTCAALGNIYRRANEPEPAEKHLTRAEELFAELEKHTEKYLTEQAEALINLGIVYAEQYLLKRAFEKFGDAISIWENRKTDDPHAKYVRSSAFQNQGAQLKKEGRYDEAIAKFNEALKIREELAEKNPARYTGSLAHSYQGLGNVYRAQRLHDTAVKSFDEALTIRKRLCVANAAAHEVELSDSYVKICGTLLDVHRTEEALPYLKSGFDIRERLYKVSPKTYERWYAQALFEYGRYHLQKGEREKAEEYFNEAFNIRVKIATENMQPNVEGLHDSFTMMKRLYGDNFTARLKANEKALYEKLYSFEAVDADTGKKLSLENSFTD